MAKAKAQPLNGATDTATKRTQLTIKYMVEYVANHVTNDEQKKEFKTFVASHRDEYKGVRGDKKHRYDLKAIREEFINKFYPSLKEKVKEEEDILDIL